MEKSKLGFQKVSAIFGLLAGLCLIIYLLGNMSLSAPESDSPEVVIQWTKDNVTALLFTFPFAVIAMVFFGVLMHGIHERFKAFSSPLASLSLHLGWMTLLLKILFLASNWFHFYFISVVWDNETASQYFRLTNDLSNFFHVSSLPFLAAWLFVAGIGGLISQGFSRIFAAISILFGVCVVLSFLGWHWKALSALPSVIDFIATYAWVILIWASIELLVRKQSAQAG